MVAREVMVVPLAEMEEQLFIILVPDLGIMEATAEGHLLVEVAP